MEEKEIIIDKDFLDKLSIILNREFSLTDFSYQERYYKKIQTFSQNLLYDDKYYVYEIISKESCYPKNLKITFICEPVKKILLYMGIEIIDNYKETKTYINDNQPKDVSNKEEVIKYITDCLKIFTEYIILKDKKKEENFKKVFNVLEHYKIDN